MAIGNSNVSTGVATFRPFDPNGELKVYVRHLPHWRQPGATYFVTLRQNDSVPEKVAQEWLDTRGRWYRAHGINSQWQNSDPARFNAAYASIPKGIRDAFEKEQTRLLHVELDRCHGSCLFQREMPADQICKSLEYFHASRLWLGDYVVMPNHVHAIIQPKDDWDLEVLLGSIKKFTGRRIGAWLLTQSQVTHSVAVAKCKSGIWQQESYDHIIRDVEKLGMFRKYIANNPRNANIDAGRFRYYVADWLDDFAERPKLLD